MTDRCSLDAFKEAATAGRLARSAGAASVNALPTHEARQAAYAALPNPYAVCGAVSVEAIIPTNRTAWRAAHVHLRYRIGGRPASEAEARAALSAEARS